MYEITIKKIFSAAHTLTIGGEREELHGHNFAVEITVASEELDSDGVVVDFRVLKKKADEVLSLLDHKYLNDIGHFQKESPTAERIARYIFDKMKGRLPAPNLSIVQVTVWESDTARATYRESGRG